MTPYSIIFFERFQISSTLCELPDIGITENCFLYFWIGAVGLLFQDKIKIKHRETQYIKSAPITQQMITTAIISFFFFIFSPNTLIMPLHRQFRLLIFHILIIASGITDSPAETTIPIHTVYIIFYPR